MTLPHHKRLEDLLAEAPQPDVKSLEYTISNLVRMAGFYEAKSATAPGNQATMFRSFAKSLHLALEMVKSHIALTEELRKREK